MQTGLRPTKFGLDPSVCIQLNKNYSWDEKWKLSQQLNCRNSNSKSVIFSPQHFITK